MIVDTGALLAFFDTDEPASHSNALSTLTGRCLMPNDLRRAEAARQAHYARLARLSHYDSPITSPRRG